MEITITINGVERTFKGDYYTLHNNDWNDIVRDIIDSQVSEERKNMLA
jgi:hypothetical protein